MTGAPRLRAGSTWPSAPGPGAGPAVGPSAGTAGLQAAVLLRPAAAGGLTGAVAVAVMAVLVAAHRTGTGATVSSGAAVLLVLAFSGLTGWLMTAVAAARPTAVLAAAVGSYVVKVPAFGVVAGLMAAEPGFHALPFALAGAATLAAWLVVEARGVLRDPALRLQTYPPPRAPDHRQADHRQADHRQADH